MLPARYLNPSGSQSQALMNALVEAFDQEELERLLEFRLEKRLAKLASLSKNYETIVFEVIKKARAQGWLAGLVVGALEWNPHPDLYAVAQDLGLTAAAKDQQSNLERLVTEKSQFQDIHVWLSKFSRIEKQVCRVETPKSTGTGFLIGPDFLITNYHVMKNVIDAPESASQVVVRFDYKVIQDGPNQEVVSKGTTFRLADDWLIDHSPYSPMDEVAEPKPHPPTAEELDYAIVRVADRPGEAPVGGTHGAPERGWISVPAAVPDLGNGSLGFILQHPKAAPLKLAFGTVTGVNENGTRLRYDTSTENGSSGSPVFDINLNLVALHHAGDPDYSRLALYNQGVPFTAIRELLSGRSKEEVLQS